jgi:TonB family protein
LNGPPRGARLLHAASGNKERTVTQVRQLVKIMKDVESSGVIQEEKDKKALAEAKDLAERTLSNLAVTWHNEAKKTREEAMFGYTDMIYSDYLTLFSESARAPEIRKLREGLHEPSLGEAGASAQTSPQPLPSEVADVQQEIRTVVRSHAPEIRACYEFALTQHPSLAGRVVVNFTINAEGSVVSSEIFQSTVGNAAMESCIAKAVKLWSFPKPSAPGGRAVVRYPFIFRPAPTESEARR